MREIYFKNRICVHMMWKANGKTTTLQLFLDSLSPKTLSLEESMDLSRDRNE
jgi:hypothetical protein